jgi:hypothetical protein
MGSKYVGFPRNPAVCYRPRRSKVRLGTVELGYDGIACREVNGVENGW